VACLFSLRSQTLDKNRQTSNLDIAVLGEEELNFKGATFDALNLVGEVNVKC